MAHGTWHIAREGSWLLAAGSWLLVERRKS